MFKHVLVAAAAGALTLLTVALVLGRKKPDTTQKGLDGQEENDRRRAAATPAYDEALVSWIPIAVPLSAVVLALGVYLIYAAVL